MELRGNLKDFSLPDIIQLVGFGRKTGALRLTFAEGGAALYFENGSVVHAEFPGLVGEEAVYRLFHLPEGEFRFQTEVLPSDRTIAMDPTNLIMEAARLLDEAQREGGAGDSVFPDGEGDDWFAAEELPPRDPDAVKREIATLLKSRFGRSAKKLIQAVDRCGDSDEELNDLATRAEKYIQVFLDTTAAREVGRQLREIISGGGSPAS